MVKNTIFSQSCRNEAERMKSHISRSTIFQIFFDDMREAKPAFTYPFSAIEIFKIVLK